MLMHASNQWATRPPEERFWTLDELHAACARYRSEAIETEPKPLGMLTVEGDESKPREMVLKAKDTGNQAYLTHFAFGQLCRYVGAPATYLRELRPDLARLCIKDGILSKSDRMDAHVSMLLNKNGDLRVRALTSDKYSRIWNADVVDRLLPLQGQGWRNPPARPTGRAGERKRIATEADLLKSGKRHDAGGIQLKAGDEIAPAGLYASDRDMFAFLVNEDREIGTLGLYRGFFVENSEVGDRAFKLTTFLYNSVCGNHIVWGAQQVNEVRVIHVGRAGEKAKFQIDLRKYADASDHEDIAKIEACKRHIIASTKDELLDKLFAKQIAPKETLELAYQQAVEHPEDHVGAAPASAWGFAQGLTRLSQQQEYTSKRVDIDRAAGKVVRMAF